MQRRDDELPFMSFAVANWLADTTGLPGEAYAVLHRLHCHAWRRGGTLPADQDALARLAQVPVAEFSRIFASIAGWFDQATDDSLVLAEVKREYDQSLELRRKKQRGAVKGNLTRWGPASQSDADSDTESESHTESGSQSESQSDRTESRSAYRPSPSPSPSPSQSPSPSPRQREGEGDRGRGNHSHAPGGTNIESQDVQRNRRAAAKIAERLAERPEHANTVTGGVGDDHG